MAVGFLRWVPVLPVPPAGSPCRKPQFVFDFSGADKGQSGTPGGVEGIYFNSSDLLVRDSRDLTPTITQHLDQPATIATPELRR